ncbi:RNA polymerase II transcriptional coactivator [Echinococcus multilocularis]|uniref:RNA polymerase II transcriptional coactivator n=1 Tax=Echinococcus multilocularis TaxID=6211 RepID=A0A068YKC7_ECHMU|nr:RNA polymerase II transcriptional coactivator [Echinococcus multilocularis]
MPGNKRGVALNNDSDASLSSLEGEPPTKQSKSSSDINYEKSANGDKIIDLTGKKYVRVHSFRGRVFVDIREYYEDKNDGGLKPGKKGISLNSEQWDNLKSLIEIIDSNIKGANL